MSINAVKIFYYCLFLEAVVRIIHYFSICFYLQKQRQGNLITNTSSYYQKLRKKKHDIQDVLVAHVLHVLANIEL